MERTPDQGEPGLSRTEGEIDVASLWRAHRRWVAAVVFAHMPRHAEVDLEDLVQEVAMKLVRNIDNLQEPQVIRPWLRTVAVNVARSAGRRHRVRSRVACAVDAHDIDTLLPRRSGGDRETDTVPNEHGCELLMRAATLPLHYREPLYLSARGLTQRQIAEALDLPLTTIETRLVRARRMLREEARARAAASTLSSNGSRNGSLHTETGKGLSSMRLIDSNREHDDDHD